jgi:DNA polymerase-3 subunit chi
MVPRVDFYVLDGADDRARLVYACRLIEKAYLQRHTVCVNVESAAEAEAFDTLLWTFSDQSFVPHAIAGDGAVAALAPGTPVQVGCGVAVAADLLVNLGREVPAFYESFPRVAELVDADPQRRDAGRRRFVQYRDRGHPPETHRV